NVYTRNAGMAVVIALSLAYLIGSAVVALVQAKKAETRSERKKCITLVSFLILPVVGVGIQSEVYGVSLIWICATLSCLMIFVTIQNRQITTDALTTLNNRYQFDKYLARIVNNDDGQQYSLIMIDIDKFKEVNDTYGHLRGDKLLASVSDVLKKSCARTNSFLSRYGGDEFAIVCEAQHAQELKQLIENNIWKFNQKHVKDVLVSLSIGYSSLMEGDAVDDLIARADAEMYKEKANRT
ncbi:MAG: GGDEF domain-containing protein, partial [Christensenella sp.]|uniref:GGDEF domain-containing protein n=1 Tax=Christensenella sp. TaxID=1935934 RepID=UPI002B1F5DCB